MLAVHKKATLLQMVFIIYGAACGGAFGLEEMVSGSGPGAALLTLAVLPFFWSIPIALACSELASAFPLEGGYYQWVKMAFGTVPGYLAGWWTWLGIFATNATFVVMFNQYLSHWVPLGPRGQLGISLIVIWSTTFLNLRGIRAVGDTSTWMTALMLVPFIILIALGLAHWQGNPFIPLSNPAKTTFGALGEAMMLGVWLYSGYDKITVSAGEVENPSRNFPLAFGVAVPFVALSYFLPTFAALAGHGHWNDWGAKYFSDVAEILGGPWLGHAMTLAALISNFVLLNTTMMAQSRLPMVMAKDKMFPKFFSRVHPKFGTPEISLIFGGVVLTVLSLNSFKQLVTVYSVTQMLGYLMIYATLVRLRKKKRSTKRPYQIPGGTPGLVALIMPPVCIALFTLAKTESVLAGGLAVLSGPVTYGLVRWRLRAKYRDEPAS